MARNQILTLRTKLLVAEYGRNRVIAALAEAEDAEFEALEREVEAVKERRPARRRARPKTLEELLQALELGTEAHALVREIGCAYENKRYLGELWRVKRFLESHGVEAEKLRSRSAALPMLIGVLGEMPVSELTEIASEWKASAGGDLGVIADEILRSGDGRGGIGHAQRGEAAEGPTR